MAHLRRERESRRGGHFRITWLSERCHYCRPHRWSEGRSESKEIKRRRQTGESFSPPTHSAATNARTLNTSGLRRLCNADKTFFFLKKNKKTKSRLCLPLANTLCSALKRQAANWHVWKLCLSEIKTNNTRLGVSASHLFYNLLKLCYSSPENHSGRQMLQNGNQKWWQTLAENFYVTSVLSSVNLTSAHYGVL